MRVRRAEIILLFLREFLFLLFRYPIRSTATLINPSIKVRLRCILIFNTASELRVLTVVKYFIFDSHWSGFIVAVNEYVKRTGTLIELESLKMRLEMGFYLRRRATLINPLSDQCSLIF